MSAHPAALRRRSSAPSHARFALAAACALVLTAAAPAASGQVDFSVGGIEVNQAVQTGATSLTGQRSTFVRARVRLAGSAVPVAVDGLMRVYVDGVEVPDSPVFSQNGPFLAKTLPNLALLDDTLNFVFLPPVSSHVVLTIEVNPPGPNHVPEVTSANNLFISDALDFRARKVPDLAYAPIDYRPSGGPTPNLPPEALIKPGVGDNFIHAIYPASDWDYRRIDAPSKLWTSSLASSGSSLLNSLAVDIALMAPRPDFLYGWIPGGVSYNGQAIINGQVSMGNTQNIRHQRTFAHELGHNHGLLHNTFTTNLIGIDVEHHLALTESLPQLKAASLKDIMYAGLLTHEAWVAAVNYHIFLNHGVYAPNDADAAPDSGGPVLFLAGLCDRDGGDLVLEHALVLPSDAPTPPAGPQEEIALQLRAYAGGELLHELPFAVRDSFDSCPECRGDSPTPLPRVGFALRLPIAVGGRAIDRVTVTPRGASVPALELQRSASAPEVAFVHPSGAVLPRAALRVEWTAADPDGDALSSFLLYSPDGVRRVPLATGIPETFFDVDLGALPAFVDGGGFFEVLVSDGLNTTTAVSPPLRLLAGGPAQELVGNAPWIEILTPDDGKSFRYGATVILHSSGWDLEDRALGGASIVWSSNVNGLLGTGRLLTAASLSPGAHLLTAQATDSHGNVTAATASLTILPRDLPDVGLVCQTDLGFGGPGAVLLSVCGSALGGGGSATLLVTGGPAHAPAYLVLSPQAGAQPLLGGTLLPFPIAYLVPLTTDAVGEISIPSLPGGSGPALLYAQVLVTDAGQPFGWSFSNALEIQLLP